MLVAIKTVFTQDAPLEVFMSSNLVVQNSNEKVEEEITILSIFKCMRKMVLFMLKQNFSQKDISLNISIKRFMPSAL